MPIKNDDNLGNGASRRSMLLGLTAVTAMSTTRAEPTASDVNKDEHRAIALINEWIAALLAKDAEKAASYLAENCQYRDDPFQTTLKQGRAQALVDIKMLLRGLTGMKIESAYTVSGDKDTLVLVRRLDTFTLGGKQVSTPMGAYFRIQNGKILEWVDTPLKELPPAPKAPK